MNLIIKQVWTHKFAVYEQGQTAKDTFGARRGTVYPDKRISINLNSMEEAEEFKTRMETKYG